MVKQKTYCLSTAKYCLFWPWRCILRASNRRHVAHGIKQKTLTDIYAVMDCRLFCLSGSQFVTTMRYFYLLYPHFALAAGLGVVFIIDRVPPELKNVAAATIFAGIFIWPLSFMAIYTRPHSRVAASEWILGNVPTTSRIATEYWDDPLPLRLPHMPGVEYEGISLPVFDQDTPLKWANLSESLAKADYYVLSSNRGYDSIMPIPEHYPQMSQFYRDLFAGNTQFEKVAEFTSYPTLNVGFTQIQFNDQWSEEAFTVYDHPKVTVFRRRP
ncbi:MAG: hypothetical protein UZ22_OP11002000833 [Microgenomates bacterium OLB23]|nr:MAG: hypothetical protein UZ22_OP11002000833 [Microgenomates bacterium OLB23]